jgi:pimeloyl-ACP methyl ester carboxylesterase
MTTTDPRTGYAQVNGLDLYYEVHGSGSPPLVLLHGALSTTSVDFGAVLPSLARSRQVIAVEQQAHGHTADIDRPLTTKAMAADTVALLRQLGIERADLFGYSMGSGIALQIAVDHPELVRKLAVASFAYRLDGLHPGLLEGLEQVTPAALSGTPFEQAYSREAPRPQDWPTLVAKVMDLNSRLPEWPTELVGSIEAPMLIIIGDSDIVRPEHAVEVFRLVGGGVIGDVAGLPRSRLAILPGTTHITLVHRGDWLSSMIGEFLDAPVPAVSP